MKSIVTGLTLSLLMLTSCQSVPKNFKAPRSVAYENTENTYWGKYFMKQEVLNVGKSGFYPLVTGPDALLARLESIRKAEKSLDIQYYIWHDDNIGKLMWSEVLKAADRGVRVRLLLDDLNIGRYQDLLLVLDAHPQIEVRMFNPFAYRVWRVFDLFRFKEINRRMHNKSMIADNQNLIIGGRNIGEEYFTASAEENFGDFDVWCFGPVVGESSRAFDLYWSDRLAVPITALNKRELVPGELAHLRESLKQASAEVIKSEYYQEIEKSEMRETLRHGKLKIFWGRAKIFSDSPAKIRGEDPVKNPLMLNQMTALPIRSEKEVFIVSPYFIPGKTGVKYFKNKVKQGVRVDVLTNSLASNDVGLAFAGYKKYRKSLVKAGVHLYELKPKVNVDRSKTSFVGRSSGARLGLHGKVYIFDRRVMFVGSMNLDPRSVELNSEMGVLFESPELADAFVKSILFEMPDIAYTLKLNDKNKLQWLTREEGKALFIDREPEASWWKSFKSSFLSWFVPEGLL